MKIAVWGLAFKPETDDMREAPSISVISFLILNGARVIAFDPQAMPEAVKIFGDKIEYVDNKYRTLHDADCLLIFTEWNTFRDPDFDFMKTLMKRPVIFDGRNIFHPAVMQHQGFDYHCIGIKNSKELDDKQLG